MENINIEATERSPEIHFDFGSNTFALKGESYPEDVSTFFGPVIGALEEHLSGLNGASVTFTFDLIYFNSSTAKVLMGLFDTLDEAAENGNDVSIIWSYEEDDDNMEELGEEFGEDLEHAKFEMKAYAKK
ncbi:DUF1987 domain-containing protein [Magnetovibrio blakemorei]|uniref:Fe-S oxidoreductase n=1 Tax=Magnetovibrio blakemorei TaxID=28181 RepID=A0A1E5Q7X7_9PROT|nr:DUF1987 domain-containing protein [Magnetovibrio blakemorei]OEJ67175.1 Fe-S oxidoreductase [Magnetovibrio blakemorei]